LSLGHFKAINDRYGGDIVLETISARLGALASP